MVLHKVTFLEREGKEKQSRYETKAIDLTQPISTLPARSHRIQNSRTFLRIYVYFTFFFPAAKVMIIPIKERGAFNTITDPSVSLSSHEVL